MKTVDLATTRTTTRELLEQAAKGPLLLRDDCGRTYVLAELDDAETVALGKSPQLLAILKRSRRRAQREGWLTTKQLREQLGL